MCSPRNSRLGAADERLGRLLILLSAVAFSCSGLFAREIPLGPFALAFWRGLFGSVPLLLLLASERRRGGGLPRFGLREVAIVACAATGSISILAAFQTTSVAHVAVIYATAPLVSAGLSRLLLRERVSPHTIGAGVVALLGVAITVGGASEGHALGDALAMLMTLSLALMAVLARQSLVPPLTTSVIAVLMTCGLALAAGAASGSTLAIGWRDAAWLAGFGVVTMSLAWPCYLAGAARVPAATTMLLSAAELPLAPLWVWLAFGEAPTGRTIIGGTVVALAIAAELRSATGTGARPGGRVPGRSIEA